MYGGDRKERWMEIRTFWLRSFKAKYQLWAIERRLEFRRLVFQDFSKFHPFRIGTSSIACKQMPEINIYNAMVKGADEDHEWYFMPILVISYLSKTLQKQQVYMKRVLEIRETGYSRIVKVSQSLNTWLLLGSTTVVFFKSLFSTQQLCLTKILAGHLNKDI